MQPRFNCKHLHQPVVNINFNPEPKTRLQAFLPAKYRIPLFLLKLPLYTFSHAYNRKSMSRSPAKNQIPTVAKTPRRIEKPRFTGVQWKSFPILFIVCAIVFTL
jgi:hypothetical protein